MGKSGRIKKPVIIAAVSVAALLAFGGAALAAAEATRAKYDIQVSDTVRQYYDQHVTGANPAVPSATVPPLVVTAASDVQERTADDQPLIVSVLGDSTGNDDKEWVELWAQHLGESATVTVNHWKQGADPWPITKHGSGNRAVTIWNGSEPGSNGMYARERFNIIQPVKPDLIIYNYGHNASPSGVVNDVEALQRMAQTRWGGGIPFVVTLQNASRGKYQPISSTSARDLKAWADKQGVPVIDVQSVITAQNLDSLLVDEVHPNLEGSRLWAEKVVEALG